MKKVLFMLAFAGLAMAANAQLILGGSLQFSNQSGKSTNEVANPTYNVPVTKTMAFGFAPTISYVLNDNMQVGISIGMSMGSTTTYSAPAYAGGKEDWVKRSINMYAVAPYFRYYFAQAGNFNFFCEAALVFAMNPRTKIHTYSTFGATEVNTDTKGALSTTTLGLSITPGVNYKFSDNWSADCYIDLAGIAFQHTAVKNFNDPTDADKVTSTDVTNVFGLEADMSAQDLNAHFGNFRIGINYHF